MTRIVKSSALLLVLCSASSMAQVSHVSINHRMFELGGHPKLRVNVIADNQDMSRLEFVVHQASGEEKLMVEELNRFLVLLAGVEDVKDDKARLLVREYRVDHWYEVKSISLFGHAKPTLTKAVVEPKQTLTASLKKIVDKTGSKPVVASTAVVADSIVDAVAASTSEPKVAQDNASSQITTGFRFPESDTASAVPALTTTTTGISVASAVSASTVVDTAQPPNGVEAVSQAELKLPPQTESCQLTYLAGETLWRIANRYAIDWQVSVYGAMLGIHEANPAAFAKHKINALKSNVILLCPSQAVLKQYTNAKEAKAIFEAKEAGN